MKHFFIFCIANFLSGVLCSQTELQKLEEKQQQDIILSKKQAAYTGHIQPSGTVVTYFESTISSDEAKQVEEKILNYKKNSQIVLTNSGEVNNTVNSVRPAKIPLSEFNTFPMHVQKYIVAKREFYETYIKFD